MLEQMGPIGRKAIEEGTRMITMLGVLLSALWLIGEPIATKFVEDVVTDKHLVEQAQYVELKNKDVDIDARVQKIEEAAQSVQKDIQGLGRDLDALQAASKINQDLLTEQRQDIKALLRELRDNE